MPARSVFIALLLVLCPFACSARNPEPLPTLTKEQWHKDLAVFARELPKRHANAFHAVSHEQFDAAVKELDTSIDAATDDAIVAGLVRLAALVGDAHTSVHIPPNWHRLALQIQPFGDEWRVTRATAATKALLGGKVTAIGGVPIADVVRRLAPLVPQDELSPMQRAVIAADMHVPELLHAVGVIKSATEAEVSVVSDDGAVASAVVPAIPLDAQTKQAWIPLSTQTPLSRRQPDDAFVVQHLPDQKTVYVNWRRYDKLGDNAAKLWQLVDSSGVKRVIIDLRQNGGGDYKLGRRYMVSELAKRSAKLESIVLIGARTFSAAMNNAIDFRNDAHALLVGGTIGERPNSYQENDELTLPASRLVVSYSTRFYKFVPDGAPNVVEPDQRVEQTWTDALAGRDTVLEWALTKK